MGSFVMGFIRSIIKSSIERRNQCLPESKLESLQERYEAMIKEGEGSNAWTPSQTQGTDGVSGESTS